MFSLPQRCLVAIGVLITLSTPAQAKEIRVDLSQVDPVPESEKRKPDSIYKTVSMEVGDSLFVVSPTKKFTTHYGKGWYTHDLEKTVPANVFAVGMAANPYIAINPGQATISIHGTGPGLGVYSPLLLIKVIVAPVNASKVDSLAAKAGNSVNGRKILALAATKPESAEFYRNLYRLDGLSTDPGCSTEERQLARIMMLRLAPQFEKWLTQNPFVWEPDLYVICDRIKSKQASGILVANLSKIGAAKEIDSYQRFRLIQSISDVLVRQEGKRCIRCLAPFLRSSDKTIQQHIMGKLDELTWKDFGVDRQNPVYSKMSWYQWWNARARARYGVQPEDTCPPVKTPTGT